VRSVKRPDPEFPRVLWQCGVWRVACAFVPVAIGVRSLTEVGDSVGSYCLSGVVVEFGETRLA
jgi:hypothetical protein